MKTALIIFVFLGASNFTFAQSNDSLKTKKISITTSLFDYVTEFKSLNNLTYNAEIALPLSNRNYIYVSAGYTKSYNIPKVLLSAFDNGVNPKTRGFKTSIEGRHYLGKHKLVEPVAILFWLNVFQYNSLKQANTGYYIAFHSKYHFIETTTEEINISHTQNSIGGYLKFGYNAIKKSGFTVDHAIGLGAVKISSVSDDTEQIHYYHPLSYEKKIRFDMTYTFKIGWSF